MRRDWLYVFALACAVIGVNAHAEEKKAAEMYVIQNAWANPENCNWDNAKAVRFAALWSTRETGGCVRVSGVVTWRALFESLEAYYQLGASSSSLDDERQQRRRVGLYAKDEVQDEFTRLDREQVELVGELGDCKQFSGPDVIMVFGFCHYTDGRILIVSQYRAQPTKRVVLQGERARKRYGNLEPYARNTAFRDLVEDRLRAWIGMIQSHDAQGLKAFLGLSPGASSQDGESALWMMFGQEPPLADRFKDVERNPRAIFRIVDREARELRADDPSFDSAVACVCLQRNCEAEWPIATVDAAVSRTAPHACLQLEANGTETRAWMAVSDR